MGNGESNWVDVRVDLVAIVSFISVKDCTFVHQLSDDLSHDLQRQGLTKTPLLPQA